MKKAVIIAKTRLVSNAGKEHEKFVHFAVEYGDGRIRVSQVEENWAETQLRPYHLLKLMAGVCTAIGVKLAGKPAFWVENPAYYGGTHPAVEVEGGKRYRLNQCVQADWMQNRHLSSLVLWHQQTGGYESGWNNPEWDVFIQDA